MKVLANSISVEHHLSGMEIAMSSVAFPLYAQRWVLLFLSVIRTPVLLGQGLPDPEPRLPQPYFHKRPPSEAPGSGL